MKVRTGALVALLAIAAGGAAEERVNKPEGGVGTVTLPLPEYNRLIERTPVAARPTEAPPRDAIVSAAEIVLKVSADAARGSASLEGDVLRRGVTRVPLVSRATVTGVQAGVRALPLVPDGDAYAALLTGPAPFALRVDLAVPVVTEGGRASFVVPVVHAVAVRLRVELPVPNADVKIDSGLVVRKTSAGGTTTIDAALGAQAARVSWTAKESAPPVAPREARFMSDVKTLVTLGEADVRVSVLVDVNVVQGERLRFEIDRPEGYEVSDVSGQTLAKADYSVPGKLSVEVPAGSGSHHQFLVVLERETAATTVVPPILSVSGAQRETGELAVEAIGTLELSARESGTLKRLDVRESTPGLRGLAQQPLLAAFRYHRRAAEVPALTLDVKRFPSAPVLAALAEKAVVTTLATTQGRRLTEVVLTVRNQAQPFLKVGLPARAQLLSADVAGEKVKPVEGKDGVRVPLLRAGFKPTGPYAVSFVYMQEGTPLGKQGAAEWALPRVDVPVSLMTWEIFLPDSYKVEPRGGNVMAEGEFAGRTSIVTGEPIHERPLNGRNYMQLTLLAPGVSPAGQLVGTVTDPSGAVVSNASVAVRMDETGLTRSARTDSAGRYLLVGLSRGPVTVTAESAGFKSTVQKFNYEGPTEFDLALQVGGGVSEEITVEARRSYGQDRKEAKEAQARQEAAQYAPSVNVTNFQRRVSGVLPVNVEVPRTGTSHRFARLLVLDEETTLSFRYKRR
jgi:hypothetical protein